MAEETLNVNGEGPASPAGKVFVHHDEAVGQHRQAYGPPGFGGLFSNYYATLCAAFAALYVIKPE